MSRTLDIPDSIYNWLAEEAANRGLDSLTAVLEQIKHEGRIGRRKEVAQRIDEHREQLYAKYGVMSDSTELIREDRER